MLGSPRHSHRRRYAGAGNTSTGKAAKTEANSSYIAPATASFGPRISFGRTRKVSWVRTSQILRFGEMRRALTCSCCGRAASTVPYQPSAWSARRRARR